MDLYEILQVHPKAEPEVIESAYKRLCKKYHPDLNKNENSEEIMKKLNYAYDILGNIRHRIKYDVKKTRVVNEFQNLNYINEQIINKANNTIIQYFKHISNLKFKEAYSLLSKSDKMNINLASFEVWQRLLTQIYEVGECRAEFVNYSKVYKDGENYNMYNFNVYITERERGNGNLQLININRSVLELEDELYIYLGYKSIDDTIIKLLEVCSKVENNYDYLIDNLDKELKRAIRYYRPLSILMIQPTISQIDTKKFNEIFKASLKTLIRETDIYGILEKNLVLVIMPETYVYSAKNAVERIFKYYNENDSLINIESLNASVVQAKENDTNFIINLLKKNLKKSLEKGNWEIYL